MFTQSACKEIWIRKLEFVSKTQFLSILIIFFHIFCYLGCFVIWVLCFWPICNIWPFVFGWCIILGVLLLDLLLLDILFLGVLYRVFQNMGIQWRLLYRLRSMRHFFINTILAVFQLKHLISKTPGLEIFKMWSTLFVSSKLTEILQNLYKFQFIW